MNKDELFKKVIEEAKKEIINSLIWLLHFEFGLLVGITHKEYIQSVAERYKHNHKVLKQLEPYFELWKNEIK